MITIKEKSGSVLTPSYSAGEEFWKYHEPVGFLTDFFGLKDPDVESYDIQQVELHEGGLRPVSDKR